MRAFFVGLACRLHLRAHHYAPALRETCKRRCLRRLVAGERCTQCMQWRGP